MSALPSKYHIHISYSGFVIESVKWLVHFLDVLLSNTDS